MHRHEVIGVETGALFHGDPEICELLLEREDTDKFVDRDKLGARFGNHIRILYLSEKFSEKKGRGGTPSERKDPIGRGVRGNCS